MPTTTLLALLISMLAASNGYCAQPDTSNAAAPAPATEQAPSGPTVTDQNMGEQPAEAASTEEAAPAEEAAATTTTPAPTATTAAPQSPYQADIDQINVQLQLIAGSKETLKQILGGIDTDIEQVKMHVGNARTKSLTVLKQGSEQQGRDVENEIQKDLSTVTDLERKITETSKKAFQDEVAKIEQAMKQINTTIDQLKAKGAAFQAEQAAAKATPATATQAASAPVGGTTPVASMPAAQEPTLLHYVFHRAADIILGLWRLLYAAVQGIMRGLWGSPAAPVVPVPTNPAQGAPNTPVNLALAAHEQALLGAQEERSNMVYAVRGIEERLETIGQTLVSNGDIAAAIHGSESALISPVKPVPAWHSNAQYYFARCLDGVAWFYERTLQTTTFAYKTYVEPLFSQVKQDVAQKTTQQPAASAA